jgi:uncharacterized protein YqeY
MQNLTTMSLTERISADLIAAMKSKDKTALEAIRAAKTAFTLARAEKGADALNPDDELKIIQKLVKQRRESSEIYRNGNRMDLSEKEIAEAEVLEKYLPCKNERSGARTGAPCHHPASRCKRTFRYGKGYGHGH